MIGAPPKEGAHPAGGHPAPERAGIRVSARRPIIDNGKKAALRMDRPCPRKGIGGEHRS